MSKIEKAMEVGAGIVAGMRVYSSTMPSPYEDLEGGVKHIKDNKKDKNRIITINDYVKSKRKVDIIN